MERNKNINLVSGDLLDLPALTRVTGEETGTDGVKPLIQPLPPSVAAWLGRIVSHLETERQTDRERRPADR